MAPAQFVLYVPKFALNTMPFVSIGDLYHEHLIIATFFELLNLALRLLVLLAQIKYFVQQQHYQAQQTDDYDRYNASYAQGFLSDFIMLVARTPCGSSKPAATSPRPLRICQVLRV
ncbi:MAG TPA: hypothetical protein VFR24_18695 [Candidatus Angelobacter sp.]|nr:hypothetical protein [Candidatus Angelobacter sp.]